MAITLSTYKTRKTVHWRAKHGFIFNAPHNNSFLMDYAKPVSGKLMLEALRNEKCIVMACNIRLGVSARGIMTAAKELDAAGCLR